MSPTASPSGIRFVKRVVEACRDRYPGAVVRTVQPRHAGELAFLKVEWRDEQHVLQCWPVGLAPNGVDGELFEQFVRDVHAEHDRRYPRTYSEIVVGGEPPGEEFVKQANLRGVRLWRVDEYERRWDHRPYLARQDERLATDPRYDPELYVPQRFVRLESNRNPEAPAEDDLLGATLRWLDTDAGCLLLVLGDFGFGKSFLLRQLARQIPAKLPHMVPMLVELGELGKINDMEVLLAQHMAKAQENRIALGAVRQMLERGQVVMLFDGLDELAQRITYDEVSAHLRTLLSAATSKAKVVLTSRTQHFRSDDQWRTVIGTQVRLGSGSRQVRIADFDQDQIRTFLVNLSRLRGVSAGDAAERLALIQGIGDLFGLSRNPRMLSIIADLPADDLRTVEGRTGQINSADLYRLLVDQWLASEVSRRNPKPGVFQIQSLDGRQLRRAVDALALEMWESGSDTTDIRGLETTARRLLTELSDREWDIGQAVHTLGSGSLLVRDDDGGFSFAHPSVMEYLVAVVVARQVENGDAVHGPWNRRPLSDLMIDFLCGSAAGDALTDWVRRMLGDSTTLPSPSVRTARDNAFRVAQKLDLAIHGAQLPGQDLRGKDLSGQRLRSANLSGAILAGATLHRTDLTDADLRHADLRGAQLLGTNLMGARVDESMWARAVLQGVVVDRHGARDLRRAGAEVGKTALNSLASLVENSSLAVVSSPEEAVSVTREAFEAAGRDVHPTDDPELLEPGPIWVSAEISPTAGEVRRFGERLVRGCVGYFVHIGELHPGAAAALDRMRMEGRPVVAIPVRALRAALADGRVRQFLEEVERGFGGQDNLFDSRDAVVDERSLFGRDALLSTIGNAVRQGEHVLVSGLRKVGKTSLLNVFRQHVVDVPVCMVDLQLYNRRTENWPPALFQRILQAFDRWGSTEQEEWPFGAGSPQTATDFGAELEERIDHLGRSLTSPRILVVLDELERIFPAPAEEEAAHRWVHLMGVLRVFSQGDHRFLGVIGADLRPVANRENMLGTAGTNPFFNLFHEVPLPLLGYYALVNMVESLARLMGVDDIEQDFTRRLFELTGGHPSLARTIAGESYRRRKHSGRLASADLTAALEHLEKRNVVGSFLHKNLWQLMTPEEQSLVADSARSGQGARANRWKWSGGGDREALASLESQGLIDEGVIRIGLFRQWVIENGGSVA